VGSLSELPVVFRPRGLEVVGDLAFNEWRRLGEALLETTDRALWSLGDWRVYGERFVKDYHIEKLFDSRLLTGSGWYGTPRVAGRVPLEARRARFEAHAVTSRLPPPDAEHLLDEAIRQGWSLRELEVAVAEAARAQQRARARVREERAGR
jgi:hypothetical protein